MVKRRGVLGYLATAAVGAGGYGVYTGEIEIPTDLSFGNLGSPPPTETKIGEHAADGLWAVPITKISFYQSGAAEVLFESDHNLDTFGVTHGDLQFPEDNFRVWDAPRFEGPKVIDLKSVVTNNGPYPNNHFVMGPDYDTSEAFYIGGLAEFPVPESWYQEANESETS